MKLLRVIISFLCVLGLSSFAQALSISSVTPGSTVSPGTLDVPLTSSVVIDFNHNVRWNTIYNNGNYRITLSESVSGNPVAVTYSPTSNDDVYTLTPASSLKANTVYKVFISRFVKETGSQTTLGVDQTYYFKTVASSDTTPPTVTPLYPVNAATNIPVDASISALFSEDMDATTIVSPATSISLSPAVVGTISYDSMEATFTPAANLSPNTLYTVTVHNTVKDLNGNTMLSNYTWTFRTVNPDSIPPQVLSTSPVNGATGVSITPTVQIVFNEAILASTVTSSNFSVSGGSWAVPSFDGDRTVTLALSSGALSYSTDYTVTVSSNVKDLAGNSMAAAYSFKFTTVQNTTPANILEYAQVPPFVAGTGVKPNLLLVVDNSGSMEEFAYKAAGKGNSTGSGADPSYNSTVLYYGYFDNTKMYKYNSSGYFEIDTSVSLNRTSFWSGNMLNWLTMRRMDVVRKVLVGGRIVQGGNSNPVNPRSTSTTNNYLVGLADTSRDRYKVYSNIYYKVDDGPKLYKCSSSSCSSYSATYNIKVLSGTQPPTDGLVTQYADRIRIGTMFFNSDGTYYEDANYGDKDGGYIATVIGSTKEQLTYQIETTNPSSWTPLGESLYEAVRYFQAVNSAYNSVDYSSSDPVTQSCQRNFVMILTDGESTKDQNLPSSAFNGDGSVSKVTDSYGFNVQTWMDSIATNEGITSQKATAANGSQGTYYLEGVSYYAHSTDLRTASVGKSNISGHQNLTIYTVFAFDDSAVGRELLKRTAKYGGYEDLDNNGKPYQDSTCGTATPNSKCSEWDKNKDGIPDTYFEAQQGQQLASALSQAFNDILSRVSSGTAASILNNSEGSGASLLQAMFYPKKTFDTGSEVTWLGELQSMWYYLDPYLVYTSVRVDTVGNNKLNLLEDYVAQIYFDTNSSQTLVRLLKDTKGNGSVLQDLGSFNPDDTTSVKSLWRAGRALWARDLSLDARTIYTRIGSATDSSLDSVVNSSGEATRFASFTTGLKTDTTVQTYLQAANATEAEKIINYIRGTDQAGYRSRAVSISGTSGTWRLGDIVSSTPAIHGNVQLNSYEQAPPYGYSDSTYKTFISSNDYLNRGMVYAGANDGMLHAFKFGVLNPLTDPCRHLESDSTSTTCRFDKAEFNDYTTVSSGSNAGANAGVRANSADQLGREQWAFIPRQSLPYLKYLGNTDYPHLFYVDGTTYVNDISYFKHSECSTTDYWDCPKQTKTLTVGGVQTNNLDLAKTSWRTVLIGSSNLGGASRNRGGSGLCYGGGTDCVKTPVADLGYSTYFALDVTNPNDPKYMWEFNGDPSAGTTAAQQGGNLGFATAGPVIVRVGEKNSNGRWFAVFASGPTGPIDTTNNQFLGRSDQPLSIFVVDVATGELVRTISTGLTNAFAGSLFNASIDNERLKDGYNLAGSYKDDVIYINYVQKNNTAWNKGGVLRLVTKESTNPADWVVSTVINNIGPVTAASGKRMFLNSLEGKKEFWLYFGTGRYFYKNVTEVDDSATGRRLYGIKDPCFVSGKIAHTCTTSVATGDLVDQSTTPSSTLGTGKMGWYINLDTEAAMSDGFASERVITDPVVASNGLVLFTTFRPTNDVCGYGGNSYIWAVKASTGATPSATQMEGKLLMQVSTGAFAEISMSTEFTAKAGRRTTNEIPGVPPKGGGLSLLSKPMPIKKIIQYLEK